MADRLSEQQAYYDYARSGFCYKQPPTLAREIARELDQMGYRLVWGGACLVRESGDELEAAVRGDESATYYLPTGRLALKWEAGRKFHPAKLRFRDQKTKAIREVDREENVPIGQYWWWRYDYVDYGRCRYVLEKRLTPEQAIAAGIYTDDTLERDARRYRANHPNNPRKQVWWAIPGMTLQDEQGRYLEPTRDWLNEIRSAYQDSQNQAKGDGMAAKAIDAYYQRKQRRAAQEFEHEMTEFDEVFDRVVAAHVKGKTYHSGRGAGPAVRRPTAQERAAYRNKPAFIDKGELLPIGE